MKYRANREKRRLYVFTIGVRGGGWEREQIKGPQLGCNVCSPCRSRDAVDQC